MLRSFSYHFDRRRSRLYVVTALVFAVSPKELQGDALIEYHAAEAVGIPVIDVDGLNMLAEAGDLIEYL